MPIPQVRSVDGLARGKDHPLIRGTPLKGCGQNCVRPDDPNHLVSIRPVKFPTGRKLAVSHCASDHGQQGQQARVINFLFLNGWKPSAMAWMWLAGSRTKRVHSKSCAIDRFSTVPRWFSMRLGLKIACRGYLTSRGPQYTLLYGVRLGPAISH